MYARGGGDNQNAMFLCNLNSKNLDKALTKFRGGAILHSQLEPNVPRRRPNVTIRVVTDSNCDLPPDLVEQHGIAVVPLHINVGRDSYLDGVEMSRQQFYEGLPSFSAKRPEPSVAWRHSIDCE
jgi:hypothetical protein